MSETEQAAWWSTGYDEVDALPDGEAEDRLYLKVGADKTVLFIDGDPDDKEKFQRPYGAPFCMWEYQIPTLSDDGGVNWRNWATCVRGRKNSDGTPMRDYVRENASDLRPYYVGFYTVVIIDNEVDIDKLLKAKKPLPASRRILLGAKKKLLKRLKRQADKRNGLRGCVYTVYRSEGQAANTGDDWQYEDRFTEEDLKILFPEGNDVPLEYVKLLAPLSEHEVLGLLKHRTKVSKFDKKDKKDDRSNSGRRSRSRDDEDEAPRRRRRQSRDEEKRPEDDIDFD